jgi:hypothetical protein
LLQAIFMTSPHSTSFNQLASNLKPLPGNPWPCPFLWQVEKLTKIGLWSDVLAARITTEKEGKMEHHSELAKARSSLSLVKEPSALRLLQVNKEPEKPKSPNRQTSKASRKPVI